MSDEERTNSPDSDVPLTGDVHDTALVRQEHGGELHRGNARPLQPTPNDVRNLCRKRVYQLIPTLNRIALNKEDKRKKAARGPEKTADQLRAIEVLMRGAADDTISATDVRRALRGFSDAIMHKYPGEQGEEILGIAAQWFFTLVTAA